MKFVRTSIWLSRNHFKDRFQAACEQIFMNFGFLLPCECENKFYI
jgi:hypothetical protein